MTKSQIFVKITAFHWRLQKTLMIAEVEQRMVYLKRIWVTTLDSRVVTKNTEENYNFFTRQKKNIDTLYRKFGKYWFVSKIIWLIFSKSLDINIKSSSILPTHTKTQQWMLVYILCTCNIWDKFLSLHLISVAIFQLGTSLSQGQGFQLCPDQKRE